MKRRELVERLDSMERLLDRIERSVEKIEIVTVVREPNTGMSADAYDGLRKQVIASASERSAHLIQLAELDAAVRSGAGSADLAALAREWLGQASLVAVDDPKVDDAFELVGPDDAPGRHVLRPGYVDALTGRVVRAGLLERRDDDGEQGDQTATETSSEPAEAVDGVGASNRNGGAK